MIRKLVASAFALSFAAAALVVTAPARAEETAGEKIQNSADEGWKDTKQEGRKVRRKTRNATGNHSAKKDMKDYSNDAKDEINTDAKQMERKVD
jgi:hypothetical protein